MRGGPSGSVRAGLVALVLALVPGGALQGETPFISSLFPQPDGSWVLSVANADPSRAGVEVWVDDERIRSLETIREASPPGAGPASLGEAPRFRISGLPEEPQRIELRRNGEVLAALGIGALPERHREVAAWTVYRLELDLFANGDPANDGQILGQRRLRTAGGDLRGLLASADYLQELGVNAVVLGGLLSAGGSDGRDVESYYRISDAVGVAGDAAASSALFREVREALARRGIRLLIDLPLAAASRSYDLVHGDPLHLRPRAAGGAGGRDGGVASAGLSRTQLWDHSQVLTREFLLQAALFWLREQEVDGLRLGDVEQVTEAFWAELFRVVEQAKPHGIVLGELDDPATVREGAAERRRRSASAMAGEPLFDAILDPATAAVFAESLAGEGSLRAAEVAVQRAGARLGPGGLPVFSLDGAELRFADRGGDRAGLLAGIALLAASSGPIEILYGTETGLAGGGIESAAAEGGWVPMPWSSLDRALVAQVAAILRLRQEHPALSGGARLPLRVEDRLLVSARRDERETVVVGVNLGDESREVTIDLGSLLPAGATLGAILGEHSAIVDEAGRLHWALPARATAMVALASLPPG